MATNIRYLRRVPDYLAPYRIVRVPPVLRYIVRGQKGRPMTSGY